MPGELQAARQEHTALNDVRPTPGPLTCLACAAEQSIKNCRREQAYIEQLKTEQQPALVLHLSLMVRGNQPPLPWDQSYDVGKC